MFKNKVHALLEQYLDCWLRNPKNHGKEPFVSIKIFEFDPGRMKRTTKLESRWVPVKKVQILKEVENTFSQRVNENKPVAAAKLLNSKVKFKVVNEVTEHEYVDHHLMCDIEILEDPILTTYTKITSTTSKVIEENNVVLSSGLPVELINQGPVNLELHTLDLEKCVDKIMEYKECVIPQINKVEVKIQTPKNENVSTQTDDHLLHDFQETERKIFQIYKDQEDLIKANDINNKINKIYGLKNTIAENIKSYYNNLQALNESKKRFRNVHIGKVLQEKVEGFIEDEGYISAIPSIIEYLGNIVMKHISDNDPIIVQIRMMYSKAMAKRMK